jgi:hypothetical protein
MTISKKSESASKVDMAWAKEKLAILWFSGGGLIFFYVIITVTINRFKDFSQEALSFMLPTVLPTLSLVVGVFIMDHLGRGVRTRKVSRFFFRFTFGLSLAYLFAVALIFLMLPLSDLTPQKQLSLANLWLGPFQGLVAGAVGAFFVVAPQDSPQGAGTGRGGHQPASPPRA